MIADIRFYPPELKEPIKKINKDRFSLSSKLLEQAKVNPEKDNICYFWETQTDMKIFNEDQIDDNQWLSRRIYKAYRVVTPYPTTVWVFRNIPNLNGVFYLEVKPNTILFKKVDVKISLKEIIDNVKLLSNKKILLPSDFGGRFVYCKINKDGESYICLIPHEKYGLQVCSDNTLSLVYNNNPKKIYLGEVHILIDDRTYLGSDEAIILTEF